MATSSSTAAAITTTPSPSVASPTTTEAAVGTGTGVGENGGRSEAIESAWQRFLPSLRGLPFEVVMAASTPDMDQLLRDSPLSLIDRAIVRTEWLRRQQSASLNTPQQQSVGAPSSPSSSPTANTTAATPPAAAAVPSPSSSTPYHESHHGGAYYDDYDDGYGYYPQLQQQQPQYHDEYGYGGNGYYGDAPLPYPGSWNESGNESVWPPSLPHDRHGRYQMFLSAASQPPRRPRTSRTERALALREKEYYDPRDDMDHNVYQVPPSNVASSPPNASTLVPQPPKPSSIVTNDDNTGHSNSNGIIVTTSDIDVLPSPRYRRRTHVVTRGTHQSSLVRPQTAVGFRGVVEMDASRALQRAPRTKQAEPPSWSRHRRIIKRSSSTTNTPRGGNSNGGSSGPHASLSAGASLNVLTRARAPSSSRLRELATPRDRTPMAISSKVSDEQNCFFKPQIKVAVATVAKDDGKDGKNGGDGEKGWWGRMHHDGMRYQEELKKRATLAKNKPLDEKVYPFKPSFDTGRPANLVGLEAWLTPQITAWKTQRDTVKPPDPAKYTFMPQREHPDKSPAKGADKPLIERMQDDFVSRGKARELAEQKAAKAYPFKPVIADPVPGVKVPDMSQLEPIYKRIKEVQEKHDIEIKSVASKLPKSSHAPDLSLTRERNERIPDAHVDFVTRQATRLQARQARLEAKAREMAAEEKGEDTIVEKTARQIQLASRPYRPFMDRVHLDIVRREENKTIYEMEAEAKARALAEATSITPVDATHHQRSVSQAEFLSRMESDVGRRLERQHERSMFFSSGHLRSNSVGGFADLLAKHSDMVDLGASPRSAGGSRSARGHSRGRSVGGGHTRTSSNVSTRADYLAGTADADDE